MVGKDGYCPEGHLASPERAKKVEEQAARAMAAVLPPPPEIVDPNAPPAIPSPPPVKRRRVVFVVTPAVVLASLLSYVFIGTKAGASNLRINYTSGEEHRYRMEITMRGKGGNLNGGFQANVSMGCDLIQRTGAVDKDGTATLTYVITNFTFSENGRRVSPPPGAGASFTVRVRRDGTAVDLEGGKNSFGLDEVNPAGDYLNPANAGPLLPRRKVKPGQSWKITARQEIPDLGTITAEAENTLKEELTINGNKAVVIRTDLHAPLKFRLGHDELVEQAKQAGESTDIPRKAAISMLGNMNLNFTQTIFTANGLLYSALGDGRMRGTMTIDGILGSGPLSIVFDMEFFLTLTKLSTGQAA
jgi:hypothetical protein